MGLFDEELERRKDESKKMKQAMSMMLDMLASTGSPAMIMLKSQDDLIAMLTGLSSSIGENVELVETSTYEELTSLYNQFIQLIKDFAKEHNLTIKERWE